MDEPELLDMMQNIGRNFDEDYYAEDADECPSDRP